MNNRDLTFSWDIMGFGVRVSVRVGSGPRCPPRGHVVKYDTL